MAKHLSNMEAFHQIINNNQLVVVRNAGSLFSVPCSVASN